VSRQEQRTLFPVGSSTRLCEKSIFRQFCLFFLAFQRLRCLREETHTQGGPSAPGFPVVPSDQDRVQVEMRSPSSTSSPQPGVLEGAYQGGAHRGGLKALGSGGDHALAEVAEGEAEVAMEVD
jgi:hypothetical protein